MDIIKKYEKFKSYKTVFAIFLITVVVSLAVGIWLSHTHPETGDVGELLYETACDLKLSPLFEILFLIAVFTAGPTIYAPAVSFITAVLYGILWGIRATNGFYTAFSLTAEVLFSSLTAYLLVIYSSFVTLTSMRIFTDTNTNTKVKNELFGGVMFRAEKFRGIFNLRYILSYIAFFLVFAMFIGFFSASRAFLLSL